MPYRCLLLRRHCDRRHAIDPVLSLRGKEIDVDRIFGADELVWRIRRDDKDSSRGHRELLALRVNLASALGYPGNLFIGMVVQWKDATFLDRPFHEGRLRPMQHL